LTTLSPTTTAESERHAYVAVIALYADPACAGSFDRYQNKRRTEMSAIQKEIAAEGDVVCAVLMHLKNGKISDATACFAEKFEFKDWGIGLEFKNRERLAEFQKTRELYPDSSLQTDTIFVSGDHVITEWTRRTTITEPFYGGLSR
jgi:hypothetical protein